MVQSPAGSQHLASSAIHRNHRGPPGFLLGRWFPNIPTVIDLSGWSFISSLISSSSPLLLWWCNVLSIWLPSFLLLQTLALRGTLNDRDELNIRSHKAILPLVGNLCIRGLFYSLLEDGYFLPEEGKKQGTIQCIWCLSHTDVCTWHHFHSCPKSSISHLDIASPV